MYRLFVKRIIDIIISSLLIVVLSPTYIIIALAVFLSMGHPVMYRQERIGKNETTFVMAKFRTMTNKRDSDGNLLPETQRITSTGRILRSCSLDEIPELFSILKGDMSFVGPRPMPTYYKPFFLPEERKRHMVRGGLIPPDSLSGKAYTTYEEQFQYECEYVDNISFSLDCKVIQKTIKILIDRVKTDYGAGFERPHLNIYRADMINEKKDRNEGTY